MEEAVGGQGVARWVDSNQRGVATAAGPLGESVSGLQGVGADVRSEARGYARGGGWRGVGERSWSSAS